MKLGVTAAELHNGGSADSRWGATGSLFATTPLGGGLDLLGEVGYHAKGSYSEYNFQLSDGGSGAARPTLRLNYTFLLVAPQYQGALGDGDLDLFVFAGPRVDLFSARRARRLSSRMTSRPFRLPTSRFQHLSARRGGRHRARLFRVLPVPLIAELRYNGDITPAYTFFGGDEQVRNRTFDFRLGLSF